MAATGKSKNEMTEAELIQLEQNEFTNGPFSLLHNVRDWDSKRIHITKCWI